MIIDSGTQQQHRLRQFLSFFRSHYSGECPLSVFPQRFAPIRMLIKFSLIRKIRWIADVLYLTRLATNNKQRTPTNLNDNTKRSLCIMRHLYPSDSAATYTRCAKT